MIRKPDFFIIGAPKCGTTALSVYLGEHEEVFLPSVKEPHYFSKDLSPQGKHNNYEDESEYLTLFEGASDHKAVGEASTRYLYSKVAVPSILEFQPDARFIVMLRHPVDLFLSLHAHLLFLEEEVVSDPKEAWDIQFERMEGRKIPEGCRDVESLFYGKICSLGEQLESLFQQVSSQKVLTITLEELEKVPSTTYKKVLNFLGVSDRAKEDFPVINKRKPGKDLFWTRFLYRPPSGLLVFSHRVKKLFGRSRLGILPKLQEWHQRAKNKNKGQISVNFERELQAYFEKDLQKLSEFLGKELKRRRE